MRLIDADALKDKECEECLFKTDDCKEQCGIMERIDSISIAEDRKHGEWEGYVHSAWYGFDDLGEPIYRDKTVWYCSNPKCRRKTIIKENFCPSCGTDMRSE